MNSIFSPSSSSPLPSLPIHKPSPHLHFPNLHYNNPQFKTSKFPSLSTSQPQPQETSPLGNPKPFIHLKFPANSQPKPSLPMIDPLKDWSFLEQDHLNSPEEQTQKSNLIIAQGEVNGNSKVLVSIPNMSFLESLVKIEPFVLLAVHESLSVMDGIKEKYDNYDVKRWQGHLVQLPNKWTPFHVIFLCCLPSLPFDLDEIFKAIAIPCCFEGTRLVISYPQGREGLELQRKEHPDVVISDLPNKLALEKAAADHSFEITKFVDEPRFYLATLKYFGPVSYSE